MNEKVGRNDPCPCGSGKKYKKCCYSKDKHKTFSAKNLTGKVSNISDLVLPKEGTLPKLSERKIKVVTDKQMINGKKTEEDSFKKTITDFREDSENE
jgi:hypothetical protein